MNKKKIDLIIGAVLIVVFLLDFINVLGAIGITGRFIDVLLLATGLYLIITSLK